MDLEYGEVFGEDPICYSIPNTYSIRVESLTATLVSINKTEFMKKYKKLVKPMQNFFLKRRRLID